ncbi:MAG: cobalt-precorrin 5A hydrolase, partial [Candidatus Caldatribacteriaceae bacterium]
MKIAILAFTARGSLCARFLQQNLGGHVYLPERLVRDGEGTLPITGSLPEFVEKLFGTCEGIVFVSATGIAVRAIAPHVKSKWEDPAVVVVDEGRRFVVSLLSGHWGGGNDLTAKVARILGATPVITTASDLESIKTPEMVAKEHGFWVEHREDLPRLSALLLEGKTLVYVTDDEAIRQELAQDVMWVRAIPPQAQGVIFITDKTVEVPELPFLILRPRRLVLGIGMRRSISSGHLRTLVNDFLTAQGVARRGVGKIASVERKRHE